MDQEAYEQAIRKRPKEKTTQANLESNCQTHLRPSKNISLNTQVGGNHYKDFSIQPVEFITANGLSFLEGCVVKRVCRHKEKNGREDIEKAIHELQLLLDLEYGEVDYE